MVEWIKTTNTIRTDTLLQDLYGCEIGISRIARAVQPFPGDAAFAMEHIGIGTIPDLYRQARTCPPWTSFILSICNRYPTCNVISQIARAIYVKMPSSWKPVNFVGHCHSAS